MTFKVGDILYAVVKDHLTCIQITKRTENSLNWICLYNAPPYQTCPDAGRVGEVPIDYFSNNIYYEKIYNFDDELDELLK